MRKLMRHHDARVYLLAQSLSLAGDSAIWLAMGIWVKMLTGSDGAAGLTFFAFICGALLAPLSGVVVDRFRRRALLIWTNLVSAAGVCLLLLADADRLWLIYLVMFGYGATGSLIMAAQTALLPSLLPDDLLGEANSVLQLAEQGLRIFTPLLGAAMLAWVGPGPVILADAATFLIAALLMTRLRIREDRPVPSEDRWWAEFTAGMRFIGRTPSLRSLLIAGVVTLLAFGIFQTVQYAVVDQGLNRDPAFLGVLETSMGIGAIVAGFTAAPVMRRTGERGIVIWGLSGMALACFPMLVSGWLPVVLLAMAVLGAGIVVVNVGAITLIQRNTPPELLGRVDSAINLAVLVPQASSIALGAAIIAVVDYRIMLGVMAATLVLAAVKMVDRTTRQPARQTVSEEL